MADKKITQLTNITGADLVDADEFVVVDISADETKAITLAELKTAFDSGTGFVRVTGDTMTGDLALSGADVTFGDNDKAIFGDDSDLSIFSNGTDSFIQEYTTGGHLYIDGTNILMRNRSDGSLRLQTSDSGAVDLYYSGASKLATTATGIDVTGTILADAYALDSIALPSAGTATIFNRNTDNNLYIQTDSGNTVYLLDGSQNSMYAAAPTSHIFLISNSEKMRIDASGRVGIGVSSPGQKLHVTGTAGSDSGDVTTRIEAGTVSSNSAVNHATLDLTARAKTSGGTALAQNTEIRSLGNASGNGGTLAFYTDNSSAAITQRMVIDSSGNVIIASTGGTLQTATAGTSNFRAGVNAGNSILSGAINNTFVGDEAGTAITTGDRSVAVGYAALSTDTTGSKTVAVGVGALTTQLINGDTFNTAIGFAAGNAVTTGTNNTLIGGQAGSSITAGNTNIAVGSLALATNQQGDRNTAVGYKALEDMNPSGNVDTYNTAFGFFAGTNVTTGTNNTFIGGLAGDANTTGYNNVFSGINAGGSNTTGAVNAFSGSYSGAINTTGSSNTAYGAESLYSNTTASNNTAVGYQATYSNTTGTSNTSIGRKSLYTNTTGDANTAAGFNSMFFNTTGSDNIGFGAGSLQSNTTGNYNVGLGRSALTTNTTASYNTGVGYAAMYSNTTGANNTAIGSWNGSSLSAPLASNTTGNYNIALGNAALAANTTASYNTAVGYHALYANTTGTRNTAVGYNALDAFTGSGTAENTAVGFETGGALTSGTFNTFIGGQAGLSVTTGSKNTILGRYNGNQGGLDIRTGSNNIVLSDGDGNPRLFYNNSTVNWNIETPAAWNNALIVHNTAGAGAYGIQIDNDLDTNNTSQWFIHAIGNTTSRFKVFTNGNVVNTNNSYGAISDVKLKENIVDAASQWDDIKALTVRKYSMKTDELDAPNMLGVIAQELETAGMSGLVNESPDIDKDMNDLGTTTKSVNYSILYMKAVKALQEAMTRIEALETKVTALEGA